MQVAKPISIRNYTSIKYVGHISPSTSHPLLVTVPSPAVLRHFLCQSTYHKSNLFEEEPKPFHGLQNIKKKVNTPQPHPIKTQWVHEFFIKVLIFKHIVVYLYCTVHLS